MTKFLIIPGLPFALVYGCQHIGSVFTPVISLIVGIPFAVALTALTAWALIRALEHFGFRL